MLSLIDHKINELCNLLGLPNQGELFVGEVCNISDYSAGWKENDITLFKGENLIHLKGLAAQSPRTIDFCYIDPPYNTGSKFLYNDNRKSCSSGCFGKHSAWMSFMLPRLVTAREVLKNSGILAVSIDDYEHAYLKMLLDHIFGEENFIGNIIVCRSKNGKGSKKNLATNHEYLVLYGKSSSASLRGQEDETNYDKEDQFGQYRIDGLFRKKGQASLRSERPNMYYPIYFDAKTGNVSVDEVDGWTAVYPVDSKGIKRRWLWGRNTAKDRAWKLYASKNGVIYVKNYAGNDTEKKRTKVRTIWSETNFYTEQATKEIKRLFSDKVFDTPKPLEFIKKIIDICSDESSVILDFFAGSGTTAHAVTDLNLLDGGVRKCILMESTSTIPSSHPASNYGFEEISDITEKRLELLRELNSSLTINSIKADELGARTCSSKVARG